MSWRVMGVSDGLQSFGGTIFRVEIRGSVPLRSAAIEASGCAECPAKVMTCGWSECGEPLCAVMLHLRARYVSKAAILTDLATRVPVENRSPA